MLSSGRFLFIAALAGIAAGASAAFSGISIPRRHFGEPAVGAMIGKGSESRLVVYCAGGPKALTPGPDESGVWCDPDLVCRNGLEAAILKACD